MGRSAAWTEGGNGRRGPKARTTKASTREAFRKTGAALADLRGGRRLGTVGCDRNARVDADLVARLAVVLELHDAIDQGVDGVVGAQADVAARMPLRAALADDDVAGRDGLATILLDAAVFRIRIAAVA